MLTIGMLGGMSWESSAEYYRLANELVAARLGGLHSAKCVLLSVDFDSIERLQSAARWDEAGPLLGRPLDPSRPPVPTCWCCARTPCTRLPTRSPPQ